MVGGLEDANLAKQKQTRKLLEEAVDTIRILKRDIRKTSTTHDREKDIVRLSSAGGMGPTKQTVQTSLIILFSSVLMHA